MSDLTPKQLEDLIRTVLQPTVLLMIVGILTSLGTSYIPGFREWYIKLTTVQKSLGQAIVITTIVILVGISSWTGFVPVVPANTFGFLLLIFTWFSSLIANQTTYQLSPPVSSVLVLKEATRKVDLEIATEEVIPKEE